MSKRPHFFVGTRERRVQFIEGKRLTGQRLSDVLL